jgi:hypothetical protein
MHTVSFTPRPLTPRLPRKLGELHEQVWTLWKISLPLLGIEARFLGSPGNNLLTILTELSRLQNESGIRYKDALRDIISVCVIRPPPLWSSSQSSWLQVQRTRVRFPALPYFLRSSGYRTGTTQPREYN